MPAIITNRIGLSTNSGRLRIGLTRDWSGLDDDAAFARYVVEDTLLEDGFETSAP